MLFSHRRVLAMGPHSWKSRKRNTFYRFLTETQENTMLLLTFQLPTRPYQPGSGWLAVVVPAAVPRATAIAVDGSAGRRAIRKSNENTMCFNSFCENVSNTQRFSRVLPRRARGKNHERKKHTITPNVYAVFLINGVLVMEPPWWKSRKHNIC